MSTTLKKSVFLSLSFHIALIAPLLLCERPPQVVDSQKPLVVDYVKIPDPVKAEPYTTPRVTETAAIETNKNIDMKTVDVKRPPMAQAIKKVTQDTGKQAVEETKLKSTREYISYYHLIREKIRQNLKNYYRPYHGQGDVALAFTLASDGSLLDVVMENTAQGPDKRLQEIAILSVKRSSPFPPFPKALGRPRMSFNLTISFKKQ